jgi:hypothetical protein
MSTLTHRWLDSTSTTVRLPGWWIVSWIAYHSNMGVGMPRVDLSCLCVQFRWMSGAKTRPLS